MKMVGQLVRFRADVKAGKRNVQAPVYSHLVYDILPGQVETVDQPDILIVEGLNVLQTSRLARDGRAFAWGFRIADKHLNIGGIVHGGMLVTFADQCMGALAFFAAGKQPCSTIDLAASFVAPGRPGDWIECTGAVSRVTRDLVFVTGRVTVGDRTLVELKGIWKRLDRWLGEKPPKSPR